MCGSPNADVSHNPVAQVPLLDADRMHELLFVFVKADSIFRNGRCGMIPLWLLLYLTTCFSQRKEDKHESASLLYDATKKNLPGNFSCQK